MNDDFFKPEIKFNVPLETAVERIWIYEANVADYVDGDTTLMDVDHGCNIWQRNEYIRYAGINAPATFGASKDAGIAAKGYLTTLLGLSKIYLATIAYHEEEKYGRLLAVVFTAPPSSIPWAGSKLAEIMPGSINQEMLDSGNAVPYDPSNL